MVSRISATDDALAFIAELQRNNGPLLFHQSGGCCDGSAPMCYSRDEFKVGAADIYLGELAGEPFFIGAQQFEYWSHTHLIIDITNGRGAGFSMEAPYGKRFITRSRLYSDEEWAVLEAAGAPPSGEDWLTAGAAAVKGVSLASS
jgi:uncharacterized protein